MGAFCGGAKRSAGSSAKSTFAKGKASTVSDQLDKYFKRKPGRFKSDLRPMMYGFGDHPEIIHETVILVEEMMVEYITNLVHKAQDIASSRGKHMTTEDMKFLIRKDARKLARVKELLKRHKQISEARKEFDVDYSQDYEELANS